MKMDKKWRLMLVFCLCINLFMTIETTVLADNGKMVNDCLGKEDAEGCAESSILPKEDSEAQGGNPITWVSYVKLVAALAFVLILLYAILKFVNARSRNFQQNNLIQNMGGTTLGGNRSIQVVKIAHSFYYLGVGEDVNLIKEVTDPDEINQLNEYYGERQEQQSLKNPLFQILNKRAENRKNPYNQDSQTFQSLLANQLNQVKDERKRMFNRENSKEQKDE
ncbi:flagellar biosynthetic protein FliO [Jeotgalibacillus proteolyticus]|uniref:Flagellar protein n=1 Tax=Jeotgalibacillus proteolyticus TaxID=2082395 RepID=A0A2S5GGF4_9BACL|nr:flagellar biosynthetic protein FliO [Jeotgalibacillus proteolyticus]PPA72048.1 hypothetical protein C4B60_01305 [Jeotgalibacillus proteolyticus]